MFMYYSWIDKMHEYNTSLLLAMLDSGFRIRHVAPYVKADIDVLRFEFVNTLLLPFYICFLVYTFSIILFDVDFDADFIYHYIRY